MIFNLISGFFAILYIYEKNKEYQKEIRMNVANGVQKYLELSEEFKEKPRTDVKETKKGAIFT